MADAAMTPPSASSLRTDGDDGPGSRPNFTQRKEQFVKFVKEYECPDSSAPRRAFEATPQIQKYMVMLQEVVDRKRVSFEVSLDDMLAYLGDDDVVREIEGNANRYVQLFYEVIDELSRTCEPSHDANIEPDPLDILQEQRIREEAAARAADEANGLSMDMEGDGEGGGGSAKQLQAFPAVLSRRYQVFLIPSASKKPTSLRQLKSAQIGELVTLKGMVTRVMDVKPRLLALTYTCESCGHEIYQDLGGQTNYTPLQECTSPQCRTNRLKGNLYPQTRGSRFEKFQEVKLQETPDQVPMGHIPRTATVHLRGALTRTVSPGDVVTVSGMYLPKRVTGFEALRARLVAQTYVEATSISRHKKTYAQMALDKEMQERIDEAANDANCYDRLASSIAPEIYGHEDVKKALLLLLTGAATRVLSDGMKIRGDINVLLMGDPGVAKSQLLKHVASLVPRAIYTTGKGSSSVGLTAAVVRDPMTQEMTLEGGALVLADMGICCIDEFDKMDDGDRTAIHEVMEQQTVSIAKAGITTTLNARCAILAAANPVYGRYNRRMSPEKNINLPNALLSRFDLLFLILDLVDADLDTDLARHITYVHKHLRNPATSSHAGLYDKDFLKAYISQAKLIEPTVPQELTSYIVEAYVGLRQQDADAAQRDDRTHVMTARQLLSILRIAIGLARLRFDERVTEGDVDEAMRLVHMSKASLLDDDTSRGPTEDVTSRIYGLVRDFAAQRQITRVQISAIQPAILKKGHTEQQFKATLEEYSELNIWQVDGQERWLDFTMID